MQILADDEPSTPDIDVVDDAVNLQRKKAAKKKLLSYDDRAIINSEIICYPITNISRPLDMFGPFPKTVKSFVPVAPPPPPNRKSSRTSSTLKIGGHLHTSISPGSSSVRSKTCSKHADTASLRLSMNSNSSSRRYDINRSRSAGPAGTITTSTLSRRDEMRSSKRSGVSSRATSTSPIAHRKMSQSPVAFGRGISKERAFAVEKKKIEEELAKISKNLHVSTRILRNPQLSSPNEVKKALQSTFRPITSSKNPKLASLLMRKSLERQSSICQHSKAEQKSLKVTVAISSRGREIMRTSTETPTTRGAAARQPSNASSKSALARLKKGSTVTGSSASLARTNSTFSVNSEDTLKRSTVKPQTFTSMKVKKSSVPKSTSVPAAATKQPKSQPEEGKHSFPNSLVADSNQTVEGLNQALLHQNEAIRTDSFFRKLFLRNPSPTVAEKSRMWNALQACKSEPSLRLQHYLQQTRPVSSSRFHQQNSSSSSFKLFKHHHSSDFDDIEFCRSGFVTEQIVKYDSLVQLSDEDEFGNASSSRGRSLDFAYSYHHERSNSEPPVRSSSPHSSVIYGRVNKSNESTLRQRSSRSPSCRRIQHLKANKLMELSSYQKELARSQSHGRTDRAKAKLSTSLHRSRSLNVLDRSFLERHLPICAQQQSKSERFRDLSDFYTCLERIGQLECATANSELPPRRRNEEIIDYDLWQKVREHEKNERELNILIKKLRAEQRDKGFLFQPHSPDEIRWTAESDLGLITKEKSVENLREIFRVKLDQMEAGVMLRNAASSSNHRDNYKPLWRASSVLDLASNMTQKYNKSSKSPASTLPRSTGSGGSKTPLGLSQKLLSTLSREQLDKIKNQLSEIYSGNDGGSSTDAAESFIVTVPAKKSPSESSEKSFLTVRSHSELTKQQVHEPNIDISSLKNVFEHEKKAAAKAASEISESEKRSISQVLSKEARKLFAKKKKSSNDDEVNAPAKDTNKPKRDISFTFKEAPPAAEKYLLDCMPPRSEAESISSETSNKTVIFRNNSAAGSVVAPLVVPTTEEVQRKVKYFEEIEREKEKVATTIYHAAEDSSFDEEDANKMESFSEKMPVEKTETSETLKPSSSCSGTPLATAKLTSSQSYSDLKEMFGERSSQRSDQYLRRSRSSSPESERYYKSLIELGDVEKLKMRFEHGGCSTTEDDDCHFIFSDSEVNRAASSSTSSVRRTKVRGHELGNVSQITHKYEMQSKRARSRSRRVFSPILRQPIKRVDRLMPHINVISKTASLKENKIDALQQSTGVVTGDRVAEMKQKFESLDDNLSLMGKMYTSVPDIRELSDVSARLAHLPNCGSFATHQFPLPEDNGRSISSPEASPPALQPRKRPSSASPVRSRDSKSPKSVTSQLREIFSSDESHRRHRYLPDKQLEDDFMYQRQQSKSTTISWKGR